MPLERARDSFQSLIKLAYAPDEHRDLNQFSSATSDLLEKKITSRAETGEVPSTAWTTSRSMKGKMVRLLSKSKVKVASHFDEETNRVSFR